MPAGVARREARHRGAYIWTIDFRMPVHQHTPTACAAVSYHQQIIDFGQFNEWQTIIRLGMTTIARNKMQRCGNFALSPTRMITKLDCGSLWTVLLMLYWSRKYL